MVGQIIGTGSVGLLVNAFKGRSLQHTQTLPLPDYSTVRCHTHFHKRNPISCVRKCSDPNNQN